MSLRLSDEHMFITKKHISRRAVLKAAGVALALPFLDAMVPAGTALAQTAAVPKLRTGFFYIPHGAIMGNTSHGPAMDKWTPQRLRRQFQAQPDPRLAGAVQEVRVVFRESARMPPPRARFIRFTPATWLSATRPDTGASPRAHGHDARSGDREDHRPGHAAALARSRRRKPPCRRRPAAAAYYTTLSFRDAESPLPMETNPRKVFLQLFGEGDTPQERAIDQQPDEQHPGSDPGRHQEACKADLGSSDRAVLDGYLESVREIERRAQKAAAKDLSALKIPECSRRENWTTSPSR